MQLEILVKNLMKFRIILNKLLQDYDLTLNKWVILQAIEEDSSANAASIGHKLFMDKATISQILKSLSTQGYVKKTKLASDKRNSVLRLTSEGRQALNFANEIDSVIANQFTSMKLEELNKLLVELDQVFEVINPHKQRSSEDVISISDSL